MAATPLSMIQRRMSHGATQALVTGASGFLGRAVAARLGRDGTVVGTGHAHVGEGLTACDLRDADALRRLLQQTAPSVVVHCAAYREPDFCEEHPEEARRLNVAPAALMAADLPPDVPLVFISSDYVFDGENPPYGEDAETCPVNVYGQTKVEAEAAVLARDNALVVRIPVLIGAGPTLATSGYVGQLVATARDKTPVTQDDVLARVPTWIDDVAEAIAFAVERRERGILHVAGPRVATRYQSLVDVAELLGETHDHVTPSHDVIPRRATRPADSRLRTARLESLGFAQATDLVDVARLILQTTG